MVNKCISLYIIYIKLYCYRFGSSTDPFSEETTLNGVRNWSKWESNESLHRSTMHRGGRELWRDRSQNPLRTWNKSCIFWQFGATWSILGAILAHWILKRSQHRVFSHRIKIKNKKSIQEGVLKNMILGWNAKMEGFGRSTKNISHYRCCKVWVFRELWNIEKIDSNRGPTTIKIRTQIVPRSDFWDWDAFFGKSEI